MKEKLSIEDLRRQGDDAIKAVFRKIDKAPNVAIIGEQNQEDPRRWALLGDDRAKYTKIIKECTKLVALKEESYIPSKKDKISLKSWNKQIEKVTKMIK